MSPEFVLFLFVFGLWAAGKLYFSVFPSHRKRLKADCGKTWIQPVY